MMIGLMTAGIARIHHDVQGSASHIRQDLHEGLSNLQGETYSMQRGLQRVEADSQHVKKQTAHLQEALSNVKAGLKDLGEDEEQGFKKLGGRVQKLEVSSF